MTKIDAFRDPGPAGIDRRGLGDGKSDLHRWALLMMCNHTTIADDAEAGAPEIEITPAMIEAAARCLRAWLAEDGISYGESKFVAEKVLRAALCGGS